MNLKNYWVPIVVILVIAVFLYAYTGAEGGTGQAAAGLDGEDQEPVLSVDEIKAMASEVPYTQLMANEDSDLGKIVKFRGKVVEAKQYHSDYYSLRVATKDYDTEQYDDFMYVNVQGEPYQEDDIVDVWGEFTGAKSYVSVSDQEVSLPGIQARHIELVE